MSELNNVKYLDFGGLKKYDIRIKEYIQSADQKLSEELTALIIALDEKIGDLEIEGSDDKNLSEVVADIYSSIKDIVEAQEVLGDKDSELEKAIADIIGEMSESDSIDLMTLVEISNKLKALDDANVVERLSEVEDAVSKLGDLGDGTSLGTLVRDIAANTAAIEKLNGEVDVEGSVKKAAADAADAAFEESTGYADELNRAMNERVAALEEIDHNHENKDVLDGISAEKVAAWDAAEQNAIDYADEMSSANTELINGLTGRIVTLEGISHATNVVYDPDSKFINIVDDNGVKIGEGFDASSFIVDGMLDSVDFELVEGVKTNNLVFTFNTASGKESIKVDFTKYIDTYHADGSSIELNSSTNTFSVKNVDATKTTLTSSIEVNGGPLANDSTEANDKWPDDWYENGVKVIPSGKSMEEILTSLFLKVTNGTVKKGSINWDPSLSAPSVSITQSGTVEVGTKITATANTTNTVSGNSRTCVFTCSPGHFLSTGVDENGKLIFGSYVSGNKTVTANAVNPSYDGTPSIKTYWNGEEVTNVNGTTEYTVSIVGTNTFKVDQSGVTAYAGAFDDITVYGSTNTKVPVETEKASITGDTAPGSKPLTSTASKTVTGARAYWMGAMPTPLTEFTSASIREAGENAESGLVKSLGASPATTIEVPAGKYDVVIVTQKEISKVTSLAQTNAPITGVFTSNHYEENIEGANGFTAIKYHIYRSGLLGWDSDTLTITYK